jgi:hypothetical protein
MKRVCVLLAGGLLLLAGSAVRAEEGGVPGTLQLPPAHVPPAACASPPCAAPACCAPAACGGHCGHSGRVWEWLCYKPVSGRCACCCHISNCYPPLYTWFLDVCQGCGDGCGHGASACAHGACAHPVPVVLEPR